MPFSRGHGFHSLSASLFSCSCSSSIVAVVVVNLEIIHCFSFGGRGVPFIRTCGKCTFSNRSLLPAKKNCRDDFELAITPDQLLILREIDFVCFSFLIKTKMSLHCVDMHTVHQKLRHNLGTTRYSSFNWLITSELIVTLTDMFQLSACTEYIFEFSLFELLRWNKNIIALG